MGMFDYVNVQIPCSKCGCETTTAQTKSHDCLLNMLDPEELSSFKVYCRDCNNVDYYERFFERVHYHRSIPYSLDEVLRLGFNLNKPSEES